MSEDLRDEPLSSAHVAALLRRVHQALARHREEIDELNVFPVPDGDTGTNLVSTVRAAVDELADGDDDQATDAIVRGAVMGAKGNSGVILSQVLRAFAEAADHDGQDPATVYRRALRRARELAYEAVAEPVEGTMLTAIRVAAEAAEADRSAGLEQLSAGVVAAVSEAVQATRGQLEENRAAGVVDAGARGFEVFVQTIHDHVTGSEPSDDALPPVVRRDRTRRAEREDGSEEYRYEVQYLLRADDGCAADLRDRLTELGDSVVVIGAGDVLNVHVHTNRIGAAIEAGVAFGDPFRIEVTDFEDQIAQRERDASPTGNGSDSDAARPVAPVVVLDGPGLTELAEQLDATVVPGTSGQLPTVADLLNAIARTDGERVAILPGHPNAVPTAHQASDVSVAEGGRELLVIDEADAPPAVLAALAVCDPAVDGELTIAAMREAAGACRCGEVVAAVRDSDTPVGAVRSGQPLAVVEGEVRRAAHDPLEALDAVLRALVDDDTEVVTLIVGSVDDRTARRAAELASEVVGELAGPAAEVDVIDGGQGPQLFHVGVE